MAFESGETNPGSGGLVLTVSTFTDDDAVERTLPFSGLAFGAIDAIPTPVTSSAGLPVAQQGAWTVDVSGGATAANQTTIIGHVDGIETLLTTISGNITACDTTAVVVASSALPTGAATAANQVTEIASLASIDGHVDGVEASLTSIDGKMPSLGQALAAGSVPVVLPAAQISTLTPLSTVAATQSGTWNVGTLSTITNVVHVDDNSGSLTVDYATTGSGNATGALRVELANNGTGTLATLGTITNVVHVDDNSGSLTVDYATTGSGNATGALRVELANNGTGTLATLGTITNVVHVDDNSGSLTVDYATTGSGTATGALRVELANNGTGTLSTVSTVTTCSTVTTLTGSGVAHDAVDSGNPHLVGAHATTSVSGGTNVADADRTYLKAGIDGVLINRPHCNLEDLVGGVAAITDGSSTSVISAAGSGVKIYITSVIIANTSATGVTVDIRDGTGGAVKATFPAPANTGGAICNLPVPLGGFTANTAVAADPSAAVSTVTVTLLGFKSKI